MSREFHDARDEPQDHGLEVPDSQPEVPSEPIDNIQRDPSVPDIPVEPEDGELAEDVLRPPPDDEVETPDAGVQQTVREPEIFADVEDLLRRFVNRQFPDCPTPVRDVPPVQPKGPPLPDYQQSSTEQPPQVNDKGTAAEGDDEEEPETSDGQPVPDESPAPAEPAAGGEGGGDDMLPPAAPCAEDDDHDRPGPTDAGEGVVTERAMAKPYTPEVARRNVGGTEVVGILCDDSSPLAKVATSLRDCDVVVVAENNYTGSTERVARDNARTELLREGSFSEAAYRQPDEEFGDPLASELMDHLKGSDKQVVSIGVYRGSQGSERVQSANIRGREYRSYIADFSPPDLIREIAQERLEAASTAVNAVEEVARQQLPDIVAVTKMVNPEAKIGIVLRRPYYGLIQSLGQPADNEPNEPLVTRVRQTASAWDRAQLAYMRGNLEIAIREADRDILSRYLCHYGGIKQQTAAEAFLADLSDKQIGDFLNYVQGGMEDRTREGRQEAGAAMIQELLASMRKRKQSE